MLVNTEQNISEERLRFLAEKHCTRDSEISCLIWLLLQVRRFQSDVSLLPSTTDEAKNLSFALEKMIAPYIREP